MLDAIAQCLNNKAEFSAEIVRDSLSTLCGDEVLPFALLRTAILAAQAFSDIKRYLCLDMLPTLLDRHVHISAPKVWEGCVVAIKTFVVPANKHVDPTISALWRLPGAQVKAVLKIAPQVKPMLAKVAAAAGADSIGDDAEKTKILKELQMLSTA